MRVLTSKEIKEIEGYIQMAYGVRINLRKFAVLVSGKKEKIWLVNKDAFELPLDKFRVNSLGLYFGRFDKGRLRLSIEGAMMLKDAKKNVAFVDDWKDFVLGLDVKPAKCMACEEGMYVIVKYGKDVLGIARYREDKLENVLPKGRKLKKITP